MKNDILDNIEFCIVMSKSGDNTLLTYKLIRIKESLMHEWSMSDNYYEEIMQEIKN